jgi:phosphoglycolate phosphatase
MHLFLLDIDGTLLKSGGAGQAAMEAALLAEFGATHPSQDIEYAGRTDFAITHDLFAHFGIAANAGNWSRFQQTYFRMLPDSLSGRGGLVLPGVTTLLEMLSSRADIAVGLLTGNFEQGAQLKLNHFGIAHHFSFGGFGDVHRDRDDVARMALQAARQHHARETFDRVWVLGDTPADIRCARAIQAEVLAVATGHFTTSDLAPHRPDVLLEDLSAPERWLPELLTTMSS